MQKYFYFRGTVGFFLVLSFLSAPAIAFDLESHSDVKRARDEEFIARGQLHDTRTEFNTTRVELDISRIHYERLLHLVGSGAVSKAHFEAAEYEFRRFERMAPYLESKISQLESNFRLAQHRVKLLLAKPQDVPGLTKQMVRLEVENVSKKLAASDRFLPVAQRDREFRESVFSRLEPLGVGGAVARRRIDEASYLLKLSQINERLNRSSHLDLGAELTYVSFIQKKLETMSLEAVNKDVAVARADLKWREQRVMTGRVTLTLKQADLAYRALVLNRITPLYKTGAVAGKVFFDVRADFQRAEVALAAQKEEVEELDEDRIEAEKRLNALL